MPLVEFEKVEYHVDGTRLVGPVSFGVDAGEVLVLLGASGSGKTTTLRLVNRLLEPTAGVVRVEGRSTTDWDPIALRRGIGYVIQETGLLPHLTVSRNVGLLPKLEGWEVGRTTARVDDLLNLVGLPADKFVSRRPHQLSGGQRQRVGVARALALDPPILLCDEPFGAVDPITRRDLQREFKDLVSSLHKTVLFVTHDVREALRVGTHVALFDHGHIVFGGSVAEFEASGDPRARAFREGL